MTEIFHIFASVTRPLTKSYTGQYDGQHAKNDKRQKINDSATTEKPVGDLGRRTPPGIRRIGSYDPQRPQRTRRTEPADSDPRRSDRPPQHRGREQGGHADPHHAVFQHARKTGDRPRRGHADRGKRHDPAGLGHHDTRNSAQPPQVPAAHDHHQLNQHRGRAAGLQTVQYHSAGRQSARSVAVHGGTHRRNEPQGFLLRQTVSGRGQLQYRMRTVHPEYRRGEYQPDDALDVETGDRGVRLEQVQQAQFRLHRPGGQNRRRGVGQQPAGQYPEPATLHADQSLRGRSASVTGRIRNFRNIFLPVRRPQRPRNQPDGLSEEGGGAAIVPDRSPPFRISGPSVRKTHRKKPEQKQAETGGAGNPGEAESPDPGSAGYVRPTHTLRPIPDHAPPAPARNPHGTRTEPGCKNPDTKKGPAFTGRTLGISAAEAAGNFTCGKPSYSRRWPRRPALPRCGATGCIWPYGPNATSNRS